MKKCRDTGHLDVLPELLDSDHFLKLVESANFLITSITMYPGCELQKVHLMKLSVVSHCKHKDRKQNSMGQKLLSSDNKG